MPYAYGDQLIGVVAMRRKRLLTGFLFGVKRTRTIQQDHVSALIGSLILAVVICAVCVVIAFVMAIFRTGTLGQQQQQQRYVTVRVAETP